MTDRRTFEDQLAAALYFEAWPDDKERAAHNAAQLAEHLWPGYAALCDALDAANDLGQSMTVGLGRAAEERDQALTEAADLRRQLDAANERYEAALEQRDAHFEAREAFRVDLEAAEARLDAVMAVFGDSDCPNGYEVNEPGCDCYVCKVRAAADTTAGPTPTGEGDR